MQMESFWATFVAAEQMVVWGISSVHGIYRQGSTRCAVTVVFWAHENAGYWVCVFPLFLRAHPLIAVATSPWLPAPTRGWPIRLSLRSHDMLANADERRRRRRRRQGWRVGYRVIWRLVCHSSVILFQIYTRVSEDKLDIVDTPMFRFLHPTSLPFV